MLSIPLIGLLYFAISNIIEKSAFSNEITRIQTLTKLSVKMSALVHEVQKERGLSAGFLGSKGKKFVTELPTQHGQTDQKLSDLTIAVTDFEPDEKSAVFNNLLVRGKQLFLQLNDMRTRIKSQNIEVTNAISYYTEINTSFLSAIGEMAILSPDSSISTQVLAYYDFLMNKERAGIERAVLSNVFGSGKFTGNMFLKFNQLVSEQDTYLKSFLTLASQEQQNFYTQKMSQSPAKEVMAMREYAFTEEKKRKIFSDLSVFFGYGGFIHNFKNYVLRGDKKYFKRIKNDHKAIINSLDVHLKRPGLTKQDTTNLNTIKNTINQYMSYADRLQDMVRSGSSIKKIDRSVKVNDGPAIAAIKQMTLRKMNIDPVVWFPTDWMV